MTDHRKGRVAENGKGDKSGTVGVVVGTIALGANPRRESDLRCNLHSSRGTSHQERPFYSSSERVANQCLATISALRGNIGRLSDSRGHLAILDFHRHLPYHDLILPASQQPQ